MRFGVCRSKVKGHRGQYLNLLVLRAEAYRRRSRICLVSSLFLFHLFFVFPETPGANSRQGLVVQDVQHGKGAR